MKKGLIITSSILGTAIISATVAAIVVAKKKDRTIAQVVEMATCTLKARKIPQPVK